MKASKVRYAKSKGSNFEYNVHASLLPKYPTIYLTKQLGFQRQFDLCDDTNYICIECKKERNTTWNAAKKYLDKLISVSPTKTNKDSIISIKYSSYLVYRCNNMPIMVMYKTGPINGKYVQMEFQDFFEVPFIKHKSSRAPKVTPL